MDFPIGKPEDFCEGKASAREILCNGKKIVVIIFVKKGEYSIFLNSCPHTGVHLEWRPDDFMDQSDTYLQCAMHGALFQTDDGLCIDGPCVGASLVKLTSTVRNGMLYLLSVENIPDSARL